MMFVPPNMTARWNTDAIIEAFGGSSEIRRKINEAFPHDTICKEGIRLWRVRKSITGTRLAQLHYLNSEGLDFNQFLVIEKKPRKRKKPNGKQEHLAQTRPGS